MSLFNDEDVANADEDPFGLPLPSNVKVARHVVDIVASEEDKAEWDDKESGEHKESRLWNVKVYHEPSGKDQTLSFFLDSDGSEEGDKGQARTLGQIKAMLLALEIPQSKWGDISSNPEKLVAQGENVVVEVGRGKTGRKWMNFKGRSKPTAKVVAASKSSVENAAVAAGAPKSNPFGI